MALDFSDCEFSDGVSTSPVDSNQSPSVSGHLTQSSMLKNTTPAMDGFMLQSQQLYNSETKHTKKYSRVRKDESEQVSDDDVHRNSGVRNSFSKSTVNKQLVGFIVHIPFI